LLAGCGSERERKKEDERSARSLTQKRFMTLTSNRGIRVS
jgi:hypothetical protein